MPDTSHIPVLIVGAGPAGSTLALELSRYGVPYRIVEKHTAPTDESRALGLTTRTLELLHRTGAGQAIAEEAQVMEGFVAYGAGGKQLAELPLSLSPQDSRYPHEMVLPQNRTQRLLQDAVTQRGGHVEFGVEAVELKPDAASIHTLLRHDDGREEWLEADWVVAGDGANSFVRRISGINFIGLEYEEKFLLADVKLKWSLSEKFGHLFLRPSGPIVAFPYPYPGKWRLIDTSNEADTGEKSPTIERFSRLFREFVPDMKIEETGWTSLFRIHRRLVDRYRAGRVLLMGDAAHIHSPASGQGLNTGVQDAVNLAWKLALVVKGYSSEALLDSYGFERRPVAEGVLNDSHNITEMVLTRNPMVEHVRDALLHFALGLGPVQRRLAKGISKIGTNYRKSQIVLSAGTQPATALRAGDRLPDVQLAQGQRLSDLATDGLLHTLLVFGEDAKELFETVKAQGLSDFVKILHVGTDVVDSDKKLETVFGVKKTALILVRPDCYIGFSGHAGKLVGLAKPLEEALARIKDGG